MRYREAKKQVNKCINLNWNKAAENWKKKKRIKEWGNKSTVEQSMSRERKKLFKKKQHSPSGLKIIKYMNGDAKQ